MRSLPYLLITLVAVAMSAAEPSTNEAASAAAAITRDSLESPVRFLAADELEGRAPGSRGDQLARLYLATEMEALGLKPGGPNGSWQQTFDLVGMTTESPKTWIFSAGGNSVDLAFWDEFIVFSGVKNPASSLRNGEQLLVGYGNQDTE